MLKQLINFYKVSSPGPCNGEALSSSDERRLKYLKWATFLSATFGYGMYYSSLTLSESSRMVSLPTVAISIAS